MKFYKRYLSLLFVFVLLFAAFSLPVSAAESDSFIFTTQYDATDNIILPGKSIYNSGDNFDTLIVENSGNFTINHFIHFNTIIERADGSNIVNKGNSFDFNLNNINISFIWENGSIQDVQSFHLVQIILIHTDGTYTYINDGFDFNYASGSRTFSISGTLETEKDVKKIKFYYPVNPSEQWGITGLKNFDLSITHRPANFTVDVPSREAGLLSGILSGITDLWKTAESGFANIVKGITELPQKLWEIISDGLKGLFVPDEQYMTDYKDKWDTMLSNRLGAVYQVCDIVVNSWDNIINADNNDMLVVPEVTIDVGVPFTFGGYEVDIVPDGFDFLVDSLKLIISILATVSFVNGLLKRYDEVMGVEK